MGLNLLDEPGELVEGLSADAAAESFRRALLVLPNDIADRPVRLARIHSQLAAAAYRGCWMLVARDSAALAHQLGQAAGDAARMGKTLYNWGLAERYLGPAHWDAARDHLQTACDLLAQPAPGAQAGFALHALGWLHIDRGERVEAERTLAAAHAALRAAGESTAIVEVERVRLLAQGGDREEALRRGRALLDLGDLQWRVHPTGHLSALAAYAWICASFDPAQALSVARRALALASSIGLPPDVLDLVPIIMQLCGLTGAPVRLSERAALAKAYRRCYARRTDPATGLGKGVIHHGDLAQGSGELVSGGAVSRPHPNRGTGGYRQGSDGHTARSSARASARQSRSDRRLSGQASAESPEPILVINPMDQGTASYVGIPLSLTPHEYGLLAILAESPGVVQPYRRIVQRVWGAHYDAPAVWVDTISQAKTRLLAKLRECRADGPPPIQTKRRRGLLLALPPEQVLRLPQMLQLPLAPGPRPQ